MNNHFEALELNKPYKYLALCKIFGEEKKTGKSKQLQILNWKRFCNIIEGEKATFVITEVYPEPKEKVDNRGKSDGSRNNYKGIYAEYLDTLLLQYLQNEELKLKDTCKIYTTNNKIAENTGIVNCNYRTAFSSQARFYNTVKEDFKINTNVYCMKDVFRITKTKIREIIKASLDRLQTSKKLEYEVCYFIYRPYTITIPNEMELEIINKVETETMQEMSIEHKRKIDNSEKLTKEFNTKVLEKVQKELDYVEAIFKGYSIVLYKDFDIESDSEIMELKKRLNELVIVSLKEKPQQIQEKTIKNEKLENWFGARSPFWKPWVFDRLSKKYICHCYNLIDILVNLQAEDITEKIKKCKNNKINSRLTYKQKEEQKDKMVTDLINKMDLEGFDIPY